MAARMGSRGLLELLDAAPTGHALTSPMVFAGVCAIPFAVAPVRVAHCLSRTAAPTHMHLGKVYPDEYKSLYFALFPKQLLLTSLRCFALHFFPAVDKFLKDCEETEQNDDGNNENVFPAFPDVKPCLIESGYSIARSTAVVTTRRVIERVLACGFDERTMWKLMKDIAKSAQRKASNPVLECSRSISRAARVGRTALRGYAVTVSAEVVVQQCITTKNVAMKVYTVKASKELSEEQKKLEAQRCWSWLFRQSVFSVARAVGSLTFVSLGCGVVVFVRPRDAPTWAYWSTLAGLSAGELAGDFLVSMWLDKWANGTPL
mmetsp:Transcript_33161/g.72319  ORF Transcript_33161/g.72319 Transcript_33161/m.72319 type:complete len:318 (-) Transcript_33161:570-1523(-)